MIHPTIEAMARAILRAALVRDQDLFFENEAALDRFIDGLVKDGQLRWRLALAQANDGLRAFAKREPSYGMRMAGLCAIATEDMEASGGKISRYLHTEMESAACWRAMLAELVKECERDG